MPKQISPTKGQFLRRPLSKSKAKLVHKEFRPWHEGFKVKYGKPTKMTPKLLADFFDHLGFKSKHFTGLPEDVYDPETNPGTRKIEDYMRKKIEPLEERQAAPLVDKTRTRGSPTKAAAKAPEVQQIHEVTGPVQVEPLDEQGIGGEKKMAYRKDMHSEASISAVDPSEASFSGVTSEDSNKLGFNIETHKKLIKDIISGLLDGELN